MSDKVMVSTFKTNVRGDGHVNICTKAYKTNE